MNSYIHMLCRSSLNEFVRPNRTQQIIEVRQRFRWHSDSGRVSYMASTYVAPNLLVHVAWYLHIIVVYYDAVVIGILLVNFFEVPPLLVLSRVVTTIALPPVSFYSFPFLNT